MLLMKESVLSFEEEKKHNFGLPTFKLPASFKTNPLTLFLTISVYAN